MGGAHHKGGFHGQGLPSLRSCEHQAQSHRAVQGDMRASTLSAMGVLHGASLPLSYPHILQIEGPKSRHLLDQTSAQAQFSWHVDNNPHDEGYGEIKLSFVFSITDTRSSMQVAGKAEFEYEGAGSGCMFSAGLWHASGHAEAGTLKVAVFLY